LRRRSNRFPVPPELEAHACMNATPETSRPPPLRNSYWVVPDMVLAGEHPCDRPREKARSLKRLLAAGIECFVDLTQPTELAGYEADLPKGIEYLRFPIRDHDVPAQRKQMTDVLDSIRRAGRAGRPVYVHCRAGIGRTGTVMGCLLVERGLSGDEAVNELNRLWQKSERSKSWSFVPETDAQLKFIQGWASSAPAVSASEPDPLLAPDTLLAARGLRERFHGALVGLAVGDAVAAATQHGRPGAFTPVGDMLGGGPFDLPRGAWSNDTAMALCLADSLLESDGFNARDQVQRYTRWQHEGYLSATGQCVGISASTARALAMSQWRRQLFAGSHDPSQLDPEPLARVAPVVLFFFASADQAVQQAADSARTTCQAPAVLEACRRLARALHAGLSGQPKAAILAEAAKISESVAQSNASAAAALDAAFWAFGGARNFREAVLRAANVGGNSDVVAAVCGQLAGAHYGITAIPSTWRLGLRHLDLIEGFADRLLAHTLMDLGP
jgi:ADP-ribosyl-[dinitrogen reductase] hydrolase